VGVEYFTDSFNFATTSLVISDDSRTIIVPEWLENLEQVPRHREVLKVIIIRHPAFRVLSD
jgi:hypothetical protein